MFHLNLGLKCKKILMWKLELSGWKFRWVLSDPVHKNEHQFVFYKDKVLKKFHLIFDKNILLRRGIFLGTRWLQVHGWALREIYITISVSQDGVTPLLRDGSISRGTWWLKRITRVHRSNGNDHQQSPLNNLISVHNYVLKTKQTWTIILK